MLLNLLWASSDIGSYRCLTSHTQEQLQRASAAISNNRIRKENEQVRFSLVNGKLTLTKLDNVLQRLLFELKTSGK